VSKQQVTFAQSIQVEVAICAGPRTVNVCLLTLVAGTTAAQAVSASGFLASAPDSAVDALSLAVWGRVVPLSHPLRDGDRLEILAPLRVDPKVARRERFARQGAKTAGLFANVRAKGKAGY
jgi:putative ubiquitin-RnfH superfamily antitoxin RatB of RatAB toxin-antitoxin module